jgi:AcrR family transcriptional regulator
MKSRRVSETNGAQARTRKLLLGAAQQVFAKDGFRNATVRQICLEAGANIAAVNYHFGDKETLYREVMREACRTALQKYPPDFGLPQNPTPQQRLHAFVRSFLWRILSEGPHTHHGKLMVREMTEPSAALDEIVDEDLRPMATTLLAIIRDLLGPGAKEETVRRCAMGVASQVIFYHHCRHVISRLFPDMQLDESVIEKTAEHVTRFSLAALKEFALEKS